MGTLRQMAWFGAVGGCALAAHYLLVAAWFVPGGLAPLAANALGFLCAFPISYLGHRHATFAAMHVPHALAVRRFFLTAAVGFVLNQSLFALLLAATGIGYRAALLIVLCTVAALTFALGKFWAFAGTRAA